PGHTFQQLARSNHDITNRMMSVMSHEMHNLQIENEHLSLMSAPQRVGCLLLQFSTGIEGKGGALVFPYDKSLAAARLGMKPETFSRALAQLKLLGVTVSGSKINIQDFSRLIDFCCDNCSLLLGECGGRHCDECQESFGLK